MWVLLLWARWAYAAEPAARGGMVLVLQPWGWWLGPPEGAWLAGALEHRAVLLAGALEHRAVLPLAALTLLGSSEVAGVVATALMAAGCVHVERYMLLAQQVLLMRQGAAGL